MLFHGEWDNLTFLPPVEMKADSENNWNRWSY